MFQQSSLARWRREPNDLWSALKCVWREQQSSGGPAMTPDKQIAVMRQRMAKIHLGLNKTDFWGAALCALVTAPFIIYVITTPNFAVRTGYSILIGGMLLACGKSIWRRRSIAQPIADAPVMEWLKYDLAKVRQHAEASRTLLWWCLLPFLIGMCVATWGMRIELVAHVRHDGTVCRRHLLAEPTGVVPAVDSDATRIGSAP